MSDTDTLAKLVCIDRVATATHATGSMIVNPNHVDMCGGQKLTIKIVPPVGAREARSRQADAGNPQPASWLDQVSEDGDTIEIHVPASELQVGQTYKYSVEIDGAGSIDPTIGIIRQ